MTSRISMKVGDELDCTGTYKDSNGNPVDLTAAGITVTSAVLSNDGQTLYPLTVEILDQVANKGQYHITGDSSGWAPSKGLQWDVRYTTADGYSESTDTVIIDLALGIAKRP